MSGHPLNPTVGLSGPPVVQIEAHLSCNTGEVYTGKKLEAENSG